MSKDFEDMMSEPVPQEKIEGLEPDVFNYMRTLVGDRQLSSMQAQQLKGDIEASYNTYDDTTGEIDDEALSINLRDEVHQQIILLKALRRDLFFQNGAPRPETEASDIKGYLSSSIQLLNLLQKFEEALKTDQDVRDIESAIEEGLEALSDHPDSELAMDFVNIVKKELEKRLKS